MIKIASKWLAEARGTITPLKLRLAKFSVWVRASQLQILTKKVKINNASSVLDVGVSSDETLQDSNFFEKTYPWPKNITAITIENPKIIKKRYPSIKVVKTTPGRKLPFKNLSFDLVVSWATLEHVGGYDEQEKFLNELLRVGKQVFITTPNRLAPYEPHSGFWFIHWFPLRFFRLIVSKFGNKFWSNRKNLNPLFIGDIKKMNIKEELEIKSYKLFGFLPSHILIIKSASKYV